MGSVPGDSIAIPAHEAGPKPVNFSLFPAPPSTPPPCPSSDLSDDIFAGRDCKNYHMYYHQTAYVAINVLRQMFLSTLTMLLRQTLPVRSQSDASSARIRS